MDEQDRWLTSALIDATLRNAAKADAPDLRQVLLGFLEVLDSLDRLVAQAASTSEQQVAEPAGWLDHLQALRRQLLGVFEHAGVTFFESVGQPFEPARHEAVKAVQRPDLADYTVIEEFARGCEWHGERLRYARVVVARNSD